MYLAVLTLALVIDRIPAREVKNVFWDATAAHMRSEPMALSVKEYDQVNIICPVLKPGIREGEQHIIYSVEKEEFDNCRITNPKPRIVAICNKPQLSLYFTITFRSFSPTPGGLEFTPGRDYYFISTSSNRDIHARVGGWCSSYNMKIRVSMEQTNMKTQEIIKNPILHPFLFKLANSNQLPQSILKRIIKKYETQNNFILDKTYRKRQERNLRAYEYRSLSSSSTTNVLSLIILPIVLLLFSVTKFAD